MTTRTSTAEPSWVPQQRAYKAARLAEALRELGVTADDVARFTAKDRRMAEKATGTNRGSDDTWRLVADMLAGSAQVDCPFCGHGDPRGTPGPSHRYGHHGPCRP